MLIRSSIKVTNWTVFSSKSNLSSRRINKIAKNQTNSRKSVIPFMPTLLGLCRHTSENGYPSFYMYDTKICNFLTLDSI